MNLMVDIYDCKYAFKVFDPENTGTIVKDVSTNFHFFMNYLLPFDDFLMRAGFLKISQRKSSNEGIQMNLIVDMDDCKDAFKVFDPENTGTIHAIWLYKDRGKCFSTSGPYIFPKFQYQWFLCGP